jgi:hypothetical protein
MFVSSSFHQPTSRLPQIHAIACLCTVLYNVLDYKCSTTIMHTCVYPHCTYTCLFMSTLWYLDTVSTFVHYEWLNRRCWEVLSNTLTLWPAAHNVLETICTYLTMLIFYVFLFLIKFWLLFNNDLLLAHNSIKIVGVLEILYTFFTIY